MTTEPTRVLVVDDDFAVARIHAGYVARVPGFDVVAIAHTGQEALTHLEDTRPDLVLLDIYLSDMSGVEVLRRLRAAGSTADIIVITAARDVDTVRATIHSGALHYLIKPFAFPALRAQLERYAQLHRRLPDLDEAGQKDIDRMFGLLRGSTTAHQLPKGLSTATRDLVATTLHQAHPADLSAAETADRTGLSRVSARRYLEFLVETGQAELALRYGSAGRPEHRYRWAGSMPGDR
jgi:response regulator of citrate/malate metabolism